ncbi:hypothetical protein JTE90_023180 [Oedothorax gibbosus]|uniref:Limulus clotting factor C-like n=1 Tax=Oedothorax gibbosus TaxID=931172 RepID=A0AAV6UH77_9ARAC|nr:hypothetical protein JTE90_023180 [Oedothorax gibbosus]
MPKYAALWFVPLLYSIKSPVTDACNKSISCPCGSSNKNYTMCMDVVKSTNNPCSVWLHCDTCVENQIECATCPENRIGPACLQVSLIRMKRQRGAWNPRRQYAVTNNRRQNVVPKPRRQYVVSNSIRRNVAANPGISARTSSGRSYGSTSCSDLASPKPGSVQCRFSDSFRSCKGTCAPGYSFSTSGEQQMTLECSGGTWTPYTMFPECISGGECDLKVVGAGNIKCRTDSQGTRCEVWCNGIYSNSYFCFPGRGWTPSLPHCARPKGITSQPTRPPQPTRPSCSCQNNGLCYPGGICVCPNGWEGSKCELKVRPLSCPDPGIPNGSERTTNDGNSANSALSFDAGMGLVFSCTGTRILQGTSMIWCGNNGRWSGPVPKCIEVTPDEITCRRPRPDMNGFIKTDSPLMLRYTQGTHLTFGCREGYRTVGPIMLNCLPTGRWSSLPPSCEETEPGSGSARNCKNVPRVPEANFVVDPSSVDDQPHEDDSEFPPRTRVTYTCKDNLIIRGSDSLVCLPTGYWDPDKPICVEDCGRAQLEPTHHVSNGIDTNPGDWPWTVAIAETVGNSTKVVCGGALISNGTVLTAAHCVVKYQYYTLYFGKYYRKHDNDDDQVEIRRTTEIIRHESYDNETFDNDIALLFFEPRVRYNNRIKPVCLPTPKETEKNLVPLKKLGSVAGWGYNEKNLRSDQLMVAHLLVQPKQECEDSFRDYGIHWPIQPGMFCAGYSQGVVSACTGDSGSPLVFLDPKTHRQTIEGLVSFGVDSRRVRCGTQRVYTVFTKVAHHMTWILEHWNWA